MSKKDAYLDKAQAMIDEQAAKIDQFKAKVKGGVADTKIEGHEAIEKMEAKLTAAKARLAEITDSAEDKWENLTSRFDDLTEELSASVKKFFAKKD